MAASPILTVGGILIDESGKALFGLRADWKKTWPRHWDSIGGHVEPGETLEEALVREIKEEIGVLATAWEWLATVEAAATNGEIHRSAMFGVFEWEGVPEEICGEHSELRWFSAEELAALLH